MQAQLEASQSSHTRQLSEAAQLRQELRQLSSRLELAESDQHHLEATCKQAVAAAEADWARKVCLAAVHKAERVTHQVLSYTLAGVVVANMLCHRCGMSVSQ